jgi:SAM-dependent methyltransferase
MDQRQHIACLRLTQPTRGDSDASAKPGDSCQSQASRRKWETFAQDDPYTYILTSLKGVPRDEFWRSGERTVLTEILPFLASHSVRPQLCLELGCGMGRLVLPLARHFRKAVGADIARGMVRHATSFARRNNVNNTFFVVISGPSDLLEKAGDLAGTCDFIYSLLVFQHIPDFSMIEGYLQAIRELLHEQGLAYLQFDTRPQNLAYRLKTQLPDFLLPRFWRRGIRRIRRSPEELGAVMRRAGLEVVGELTPNSAYHRYILRRPPSFSDSK